MDVNAKLSWNLAGLKAYIEKRLEKITGGNVRFILVVTVVQNRVLTGHFTGNMTPQMSAETLAKVAKKISDDAMDPAYHETTGPLNPK